MCTDLLEHFSIFCQLWPLWPSPSMGHHSSSGLQGIKSSLWSKFQIYLFGTSRVRHKKLDKTEEEIEYVRITIAEVRLKTSKDVT